MTSGPIPLSPNSKCEFDQCGNDRSRATSPSMLGIGYPRSQTIGKFERRQISSSHFFPMSSQKSDVSISLDALHRLPGSDDQQEAGLIIKKKAQAVPADEQHVFKVPQIPPSSFGLDKLAAEKRRLQSVNGSAKRTKTSAMDDIDDDDDNDDSKGEKSQTIAKERHLREKRVETPSSTRSSHHDQYERSRTAAKNQSRGLTYGKEGHKQRRQPKFTKGIFFTDVLDRSKGERDDEQGYATPNIHGSRGQFAQFPSK